MMTQIVTDKAGRRIELRRVGVLEQLRLFKALGPDLSENRAYVGLARIAASVSMIDDVPIPFPVNENSLEAVIERLGEDGVEAVGEAIIPAPIEQILDEAGN